MKTNILRALVLPVAAFALASAGAVSTNTAKVSKTNLSIQAYIHNPSVDDCEEVTVECSPGNGPACLSGSFTAYGKASETSPCVERLQRND
jgi:hypothetical protein